MSWHRLPAAMGFNSLRAYFNCDSTTQRVPPGFRANSRGKSAEGIRWVANRKLKYALKELNSHRGGNGDATTLWLMSMSRFGR